MRKSTAGRGSALKALLVLGLAASAFAADGTVQFEQGIQPLTFGGGVGGGEFGAYGFSNPSILAPIAPPVQVTSSINGINGFQFQTFCLEPGTPVAFHTPLDYTVSTTVQLPNGATRNLKAATAYLFTKFWTNTAFASPYAYSPLGGARSASAANMQLAIWFTEGVSSFKSGIVSDYVDEAITATSAGGSWANTWGTTFPGNLGNVRALNIAQGTVRQQDVLVLLAGTQPPPPPPMNDCKCDDDDDDDDDDCSRDDDDDDDDDCKGDDDDDDDDDKDECSRGDDDDDDDDCKCDDDDDDDDKDDCSRDDDDDDDDCKGDDDDDDDKDDCSRGGDDDDDDKDDCKDDDDDKKKNNKGNKKNNKGNKKNNKGNKKHKDD